MPARTTIRITSVVPVNTAMWRQPMRRSEVSDVPRPSAPIAISRPQVEAWISTYTAIASGELAAVTTDVQRVTGRPPTSLAD